MIYIIYIFADFSASKINKYKSPLKLSYSRQRRGKKGERFISHFSPQNKHTKKKKKFDLWPFITL